MSRPPSKPPETAGEVELVMAIVAAAERLRDVVFGDSKPYPIGWLLDELDRAVDAWRAAGKTKGRR